MAAVGKEEERDGIWVNGKFYPEEEDGFERIERKSPRPPKRDEHGGKKKSLRKDNNPYEE